jgi:hypothetical protein
MLVLSSASSILAQQKEPSTKSKFPSPLRAYTITFAMLTSLVPVNCVVYYEPIISTKVSASAYHLSKIATLIASCCPSK